MTDLDFFTAIIHIGNELSKQGWGDLRVESRIKSAREDAKRVILEIEKEKNRDDQLGMSTRKTILSGEEW